jgi:hypothetical protein
MPALTQKHRQTIHDLTSTEGLVPLILLSQKSAVLYIHRSADEHHTKKAGSARQPHTQRFFEDNTRDTHTQAPRDTRACHTAPSHSGLLPTARAPAPTHSKGFCVIRACVSSSSSSEL